MLTLMRLRLFLVLGALLCLSHVDAQQLRRTSVYGLDYVSVTDLARGLGTAATRLGSSVTVRTGFGILTLFEGEAGFLWRAEGSSEPRELRLSAQTVAGADGLWVPLELLQVIGATVSGVVVIMPDRTRLVLESSAALPAAPEQLPAGAAPALPAAGSSGAIELGAGVRALRFVEGDQSVLLADLGLFGLLQPGRRASFDAFMQELSGYRPLYFVLSASSEGSYSLEFTFVQDSRVTRLGPDDGVVLLQGSGEAVTPGDPVSGIVLLPETTNLRRPLQVQWQQQTASMVFRR